MAAAADVADLKPEVVAACREWLPFEEVEELVRLYGAFREQWCGGGAGDLKRSGRRGLQREVGGDKVDAAHCLERKAEELDLLAETAAVEAAREAAGLRVEVAKFRQVTMERWKAAVHLVSRFETAAWPALEAGGQICVVDAKLRKANLVEALLSDWKAFSALREPSDDEADQLPAMYSDASRAAEAAERLGLLVEIAGGVVGADLSVTLAAIERQAKRLESQLVAQLLFAAALRDDDEREASSSTKPLFRTRDEDAMVIATEALDKLRQPRAGLGHFEWRDAVLRRVHTCWRRELEARPGSRDLDCAIAAARSVLCGRSGELAATIRVVLRATRHAKREHRLVDVRAATRALMQGLVNHLGLKNAVLDVLANADYEDADAADQLSQLSTKYLDAIAELAATVDKLRRALERTVDEALFGTSASKSKDRKRQDDDHDDDDANDEKELDAPRELGANDAPMFAETAKREISAATNSLLEAARAGYARREADWFEAALVVAGRELASATTNVDCADRSDSNSGSNSALFGRPWRRRRQRAGREEEDEASDDEASSRKVLGSEAAVPTDASLSALLRVSLARPNFNRASASLAASLKRCVAVLPHRGADIATSDCRALARDAVLDVLDRKGGHDDAIRRGPPGRSSSTSLPSADDISRDIVGRARRFAYHHVLRPSVRVAKARMTEIHSAYPVHKAKPGGLFASSSSSTSHNQARRDQAGDEPPGSPPRAFFDVVVAVLDAEARWRTLEAGLLDSHAPNDVELREGASAALRADLGDALRVAQAFFADILAAKLPAISNPMKHDYAIATEPLKLQPTRPVADICAALKAHAQTVAAILRANPGEKPDALEQNRARDIVAMLAARWRIALASDVFGAFTRYVDSLRITPAGAFVLSRDLDELRAAVAELGCTTTDANFLQLRENCALLKLDKSDLNRLLLYDTTDTFSQNKAKLSKILLTRADAWSRSGAKLPWVEDLIEELHLPPDARYCPGADDQALASRAREIGVQHRAAMLHRTSNRYSAGAGVIISTRLHVAALAARGLDDEESTETTETGRMVRSLSWLEDAERAIAERHGQPEAQARPIAHKTGFTLPQAFFAAIKSAVGPAVLYMPKGFQEGGLSFAFSMLLLSYALFGFGAMRLLESWRLCHKSYASLMGKAYGKKGTMLVRLTIVAQQCGICLTYFVFVATNAKELVEFAMPSVAAPSLATLCIAQVAVYVPIACVRNVQNFAYFNLLANALILYALLVLTVFASFRVVRRGAAHTLDHLTLFNPTCFYLFIGTSAFVYEGSAALIVPLQEAVRDDLQAQFAPLYLKTMMLIVFVYIAFGVVNWAAYGSSTETVLTVNLPDGAWKASVQLAYLVAVMFTFPLQLFPAVQILKSLVHKLHSIRRKASLFRTVSAATTGSQRAEYEPVPVHHGSTADDVVKANQQTRRLEGNVARGVLVVLLAGVSVLEVHSLDKLVALIGGLLGIPLAFVYPLVIHLRLVPDAPRTTRILDVVCIVVGLSLGLACTIVSLGASLTRMALSRSRSLPAVNLRQYRATSFSVTTQLDENTTAINDSIPCRQ